MRSFLSLGANLGDAKKTLQQAITAIDAVDKIKVLKVSSFYKTAPVDATGPDYVNAVLAVETDLPPLDLLKALQAIENAFGRVRPTGIKNAPRTLDIDVLTYGDCVQHDAQLILPHPRMHQRAFVLIPLKEIEPAFTHPAFENLDTLIEHLTDQRIECLKED